MKRARETDTHTESARARERQTDTHTERERKRERERQKERENVRKSVRQRRDGEESNELLIKSLNVLETLKVLFFLKAENLIALIILIKPYRH